MDKRMLINAVETEECRIAILENNVLEELYIERSSRGQIAGNIYKGKVVNVESSIEAAFIDIGLKKMGFFTYRMSYLTVEVRVLHQKRRPIVGIIGNLTRYETFFVKGKKCWFR